MPSSDMPGQRMAAALLLCAGGGAFALALWYVWPFTADDAFITFRYARNWIAGFGPNFNVDGAPSEGVTSFGYLVISCLPQVLGLDAEVFAKVLGVAAALATASLASQLARELVSAARAPERDARLAAAFAAALFLASHAAAVHAASGMETLAAAGLLTALVQAHLRFARGGAALPIGVLSLALGLVRPELNVVAALLIGVTAVQVRARRAVLARMVGVSYLLPGAIYFAARAAYYGHALPIPFYAKIPGGAVFPGARGVGEFARLLLAPSALFLAMATAVAPRAMALAWIGIGSTMAVALLPDPVMDFEFRYCMPAAGLAAAVAGAGFARLCGLVSESQPARARLLAIGFTLAAIALLAVSGYEPALAALRERRAYGQALASTYVRLGHVLADYPRTSAALPVIALGDVGAIPYHSGWRVIDTFSLNDPAIAIEGRHDPEYVLDQQPDVVGVVSDQGPEFHAHWANRHDGPLFEAALARGMKPAVILAFSARSYLYLMAQPDSNIARYLARVYLPRNSDRG